ncbi:MAG: UDP-4-amino-4,6-dideoxy-N-acetyl-beta-L-altrosamine transaminase [Proteobacteria bacterium]|nr:UDP-4-amino-4,6-dideoxy-N-acetyl-beta-L-altrosamine transaminase [Pseudomonadota bacterium]MBU4296638.1 UDP-4-amino-4,6-dideoxy-N-acetyl-beta-L-altrosamine transaminase [Pseudomonadota bacterium]MCG2748431.1 UDP-4-amino-4,6-dideoxy-N-acetyl-beta-L-altrosamine transaminase [Desulfobulbaceae bacterium]
MGFSREKEEDTDRLAENDSRAFIPYGRQQVDEDDIQAVAEVLRSDWLTTGPQVGRFEEAVATFAGARHGVAVSSGTAALHGAMHAIGIGPGDEVIVPAITFVATANCVVYQGGIPVLADVDKATLLIDPDEVRQRITAKTRAIIAVDYAGQPCDYDRLRKIADEHNLYLVSDSCHSLGGEYRGRRVAEIADLTVFSFHPVKHITTGEGGMVVTDQAELAEKMKRFRNHGIATDHRQRETLGTWYYEMTELGFNYRISDIACALGLSQLQKLPAWLARRREIAALYRTALQDFPDVQSLRVADDVLHAFHLYVVRFAEQIDRAAVFRKMRAANIGVNVHYLPIHFHPYYRQRFGEGLVQRPEAEAAYDQILSLPMYPDLTNDDVIRVISTLRQAVASS